MPKVLAPWRDSRLTDTCGTVNWVPSIPTSKWIPTAPPTWGSLRLWPRPTGFSPSGTSGSGTTRGALVERWGGAPHIPAVHPLTLKFPLSIYVYGWWQGALCTGYPPPEYSSPGPDCAMWPNWLVWWRHLVPSGFVHPEGNV